MQKFKIKSLTDVITNSSTEVFTIYNKGAEELINQLAEKLKERGNKEHAEAIKTTVTTEEELWNYSKQNNIYDVVMEIIEEIDNDTYDYRMVDGIHIKAKNNPNVDKAKLGKAVEMLNNIDHIFEQYASYC